VTSQVPPLKKLKRWRRISQISSLLLWTILLFNHRFALVGIILALAIISSVFVGRAFCSWACPLGTIYELVRLKTPHKWLRPHCRIGCPFSLIIGSINKTSIFRIKKEESKCIHCGTCDQSCLVGLVELGTGYAELAKNPSSRYACIRCLNCLASCPQGALSLRRHVSP